MRMRIISTAIVLAVGIVGITLAQQTGQRPNDRNSERAKLRAQVVKLRVDIELLQLDHDAERDILLACLTQVKQPDFLASGQPGATMTMSFDMRGMPALIGDAEAQKKIDRDAEKGDEVAVALRKAQQGLEEALRKQTNDIRAYIERKSKDFARQAAELAEKRLGLAEVEKRYNEAIRTEEPLRSRSVASDHPYAENGTHWPDYATGQVDRRAWGNPCFQCVLGSIG
jgi:hypothetical protein